MMNRIIVPFAQKHKNYIDDKWHSKEVYLLLLNIAQI